MVNDMGIKQISSFLQKNRFYDRLIQSIESENVEGITIEQVTYESDSKTIHYKEVVVKRKRTHIMN